MDFVKNIKKNLKGIDWKKHNPMYMNFFVMCAGLLLCYMYISFTELDNMNNRSEANISNLVLDTNNKVQIKISYDGTTSNLKDIEAKIKGDGEVSIDNIINHINASKKANFKVEENNNGKVLVAIDDKSNVLNGKNWNVYKGNSKIENTIDKTFVKNGSRLLFIYE